jgi:hypothetical protein
MRAGLLGALLLSICVACGAKVRDARPLSGPAVSARPAAIPEVPVAKPAAPALPTLDALASRQVRLAPGMRELARGEASGQVVLPTVTRDTCVRVTYVAAQAVSVSLVSHDGAVLARNPPEKDGAIEKRGPVCFHPDAAPHLEAAGDAGAVRYVIWAAP